jgi:1-acyl-sn-glycerol-3-phosphate acyltransferase
MIVIFHILFYLLIYILLVLYFVVALPFLLFSSNAIEYAAHFWAKSMMALAKIFLGIDYAVSGTHNVLLKSPFILACKHQSAWETVSLFAILKNPAFVLKNSLLNVPIVGFVLKKLNMIPVYRGKKNIHFLEKARIISAENRPIVIFPEGTRATPGQPHRYFRGVFALYKDLQIPVVPAALNSGIFWPRRRFLKKKGTINVDFMAPIPPGLEESVFMKTLEEAIESRSDALCRPYLK